MHLFTYGTLMFPEVWQAVLGDIIVGKDFATTPAQLPGYEIYRVAGALYPGIVKSSHQPSAVSHQLFDSPSGPPPSALNPPPSAFAPTSDLRPLTSVPGLLYHDLDPASLARLDAFEGTQYIRRSVTVICKDVTCADGQTLTADTYIVPTESAHILTAEPWTAEVFLARGLLPEFVARYSGFDRLAKG